MIVAVTSAGGRLGRRVARLAQGEPTNEVRQLSHFDGNDYTVVDLPTGEGLHGALRGVEVLVHAASSSKDPWNVDVVGARRIAEAMDRTSLRHLVYISIVGVDRIPFGYYHAKFAAEQVLRASGLPLTIVRSTQFHTFLDDLLRERRHGPLLAIPGGWRVQPVDINEVAEVVWETALGEPTNDVFEVAGPAEIGSKEIARLWAETWIEGHPEEVAPKPRVLPVPLPGKLSNAFKDGLALPGPDARLCSTTYAQHLEQAAGS
jgi:uncharacterized protein YbjT (DUF2867 family)